MQTDLDRELESNPEYQRILAQLSPDERSQLLGQNYDLASALGKKREFRRSIARLSPAQKLRLLDELRMRAEMQRGSRHSATPFPKKAGCKTAKGGQAGASHGEGAITSSRVADESRRYGGRATAVGVGYEVHVAALIAVKMLCGEKCSVWESISGAEVSAITMQGPEPVDDVVVSLRGHAEAQIFISAKERSGTIALTAKSREFAETVDAFVRQFLRLSSAVRKKSRLIWAVPSNVGGALTHTLPMVLKAHREEADDTPLSDFLNRRTAGEKKILNLLISVSRESWRKQSGSLPADDELRGFLNRVYVEIYDFECGQRHERQAEDYIRSHIIADPMQAKFAWEALENFLTRADQRGIRVTPASLRKLLTDNGLRLNSPPDYAADIEQLVRLTEGNLDRLKKHTILPFGPNTSNLEHIDRNEEVSALVKAAKSGHLLITGEPGCGKSGLIYALSDALQKEGFPVLLLLAEDGLPDLAHQLGEVLTNWPNGARGFLITDALDAVRDPEAQRQVRKLLRDVQNDDSGWTVIASVREFDLKYGRELRELFPGEGVVGHFAKDFAGVAHFYLRGLSEAQLESLSARRPGISPFIENARRSAKSEGMHHSPFYLRLSAELLRDGIPPLLLGDWNSPAVLLRKFWERRINEGARADERRDALRAICLQMVNTRSMTLSLKELPVAASTCRAIDDLRSRGLLQAPALRYGTLVGGDEVRFTHHLLHDYAVAKSLIPETQERLSRFVISEPLLPVFYRQSLLFTLEELWDAPGGREGFWKTVIELERSPKLQDVTRILGPILAARRVGSLDDLQPLLTALGSAEGADSPSPKALRHLASGLQDAGEDAIRAGMAGWCAFAEQLAIRLTSIGSLEQPLALIVGRINEAGGAITHAQRLALNAAGRGLLACHVSKEVSKGWRYASRVATETICRTFSAAPAESERSLLALLSPERLAYFPSNDLFDLSLSIKHLGVECDSLVVQLFEAAFAGEPKMGEYDPSGSAILPIRFQTSDAWKLIRHALADYLEARTDASAALMTEAACIAWNAVVQSRRSEERVLARFQFRGASCELVEDYSHIWGRQFEQDENRILTHFEKWLRQWAAAGDAGKLNEALDHFAARNRTSLMWTVFTEAGAEYPSTLGMLLQEVLSEPLFLIHPDYSYGGTALLGALHRAGDPAQRKRLEELIVNLEESDGSFEEETQQIPPPWLEHAQNRLLGAIDQENIVLDTIRGLWRERQRANALVANPKPEGPRGGARSVSAEEMLGRRGIKLENPANREMLRLREELKPLLSREDNKVNVEVADRCWTVIEQCEHAVEQAGDRSPEMAQELWGYLVGACESIARHIAWHLEDGRWKTVRRILLRAAQDPMPLASDEEEPSKDAWPSWGWPSPRLDAACGLLWLAYHLGHADEEVSAALRTLISDKSDPLRFNLARELAALEQSSPALMWELIDAFISNEKRFSVLDALVLTMEWLWKSPEKVKPRLHLIAGRVAQSAPADNHIHETLAGTYLFEYLRTGDAECRSYISALIADCDVEAVNHALLAQLYECRGLWMPSIADSQAGPEQRRTCDFFAELLTVSQARLKEHRETLQQLHEHGQPNDDTLKTCTARIDRAFKLVNGIAVALYYASGASHEKTDRKPSIAFWRDAAPLFAMLADEPHPHAAYHVLKTLRYLLPCEPREAFLLAARCIHNSSSVAGFQYESLAVGEVVALIQQALADHRDIFQSAGVQSSECLKQLLQILDVFVEAGWSEARQLTHRLEDIYR
jgi:hypothetical protein